MNITKILAEEVANKMVEPLEKKKSNLLHDEQVRITEEVIENPFREITDCFKSFSLISLLHIASHCLWFLWKTCCRTEKGFPAGLTLSSH